MSNQPASHGVERRIDADGPSGDALWPASFIAVISRLVVGLDAFPNGPANHPRDIRHPGCRCPALRPDAPLPSSPTPRLPLPGAPVPAPKLESFVRLPLDSNVMSIPPLDPNAHVRPATPGEQADIRAMHRSNRAAWDEAAERYERWLPEAIELIRSGGTNLLPPELELIGDLHGRCRRAIHLQCAGGRDTLSLWNLGADEVIGVDFSPRMLALAERLTAAVGAPARWIRADVLDTPHELDGTADLLYTGRGSLMWLQDLDSWAAVLVRLLAPGGRFVLFEGHPVEWLFDVDDDGRWFATDYDYFAGPEASKGWAPEYIDHLAIDEADQSWKFARAWTLGEILTALLGSGLRLERIAEHPTDWWAGHGDVRPEERGRIPLSFSVVARRDEG